MLALPCGELRGCALCCGCCPCRLALLLPDALLLVAPLHVLVLSFFGLEDGEGVGALGTLLRTGLAQQGGHREERDLG